MIVLAGDVGGTNARLALVDIGDSSARIVHQATYPSPRYPGLAPIIQQFKTESGAAPTRACFGVPGPVIAGTCRTPNLAWTLDTRELIAASGIPEILLINDFNAVGHGIGWLGENDVATLRAGTPRPYGQQLYIGAGTGMGVGIRVHDGRRWHIVSSEGGHAPFPPRNEEEWQLAEWIRRTYQHAAWERIVSGPGLVNIYRFLVDTRGGEAESVRNLMQREDPAAVISTLGVSCGDPLCQKALQMFLAAYGSAVGTYACVAVATGGVYLAGGIAPRLVQMMMAGDFIDAFLGTADQRAITEQLPLHVITRGDVGVIGAAAAAAMQELRS